MGVCFSFFSSFIKCEFIECPKAHSWKLSFSLLLSLCPSLSLALSFPLSILLHILYTDDCEGGMTNSVVFISISWAWNLECSSSCYSVPKLCQFIVFHLYLLSLTLNFWIRSHFFKSELLCFHYQIQHWFEVYLAGVLFDVSHLLALLDSSDFWSSRSIVELSDRNSRPKLVSFSQYTPKYHML